MPTPFDDIEATPAAPVAAPAGPTTTATEQPTTSVTPAVAPEVKPAEQPVVSATPKEPLTDEQISAVADKFFNKFASKATPVQQEKKGFEVTPELAESLKPVRVTPQLLAGLGFDGATPEQVQAFQMFADSIVTHAAHVSAFLQQQAIRDAEAKFTPYASYIEEQRANEHRASFYNEHKDLQKYGRFVSFAAGQVQPTKPDGSYKSASEISKEVADATRRLLKEAGVNLDSQSNANQGTAGAGTAVPKMLKLDTAGGSMSGSNQGKQGKSSIFED